MASRSDSDRSSDGWTSLRELVLAYNIDKGKGKTFAEVRKEFQDSRKLTIVDEYYSPSKRYTGAVLVEELHKRWLRETQHYRFKLRYDASDDDPRIGRMLAPACTIERKWSFLLNKTSQKILEQITYTLIVYLLSFLRTPTNVLTRGKLDQAIVSAQKQIDFIVSFARDSAKRAALQWYLSGLPIGFIAGSGIAWRVWYIPSGVAAKETLSITNQAALCLAAGGIGAVISVMIRITRRRGLDVDIEQGRIVTMLAGGFRSLIGAVLGAALYILIGGGLIPLPLPNAMGSNIAFFYTGLAFLAGFSERWAQDTIVHSAPRIPNSSESTSPDDPKSSVRYGDPGEG